jgi:hypothetical protein
MATDDHIFTNEKTKTVTRFLWWLAVILVFGTLGGMYLFFNRPARSAKIAPETCSTMCGSTGVQEYSFEECKCRPPEVPIPAINISPTTVEKIDKVVCTCRPATRLEEHISP